MQYGSLVNMMSSSSGVPKVGEGATFLNWSDRSPGTVSRIVPFKSGPNKGKPRLVYVRPDKYGVVSGSTHDGSAKYEFEQDPDAREIEFLWTGKRWRSSGGGSGIAFGYRDAYHDPTI